MKVIFGLIALLLLGSCAPTIRTPAYALEGAASTGTFTATLRGALTRQLKGTAYTTRLAEPSTGLALSLGVNDGATPCVVTVALARAPRVGDYVSFVQGATPSELSFSSALYCQDDSWTVFDRSGTLTFTAADDRLVGTLELPLESQTSGTRVQVQARFNLKNP